MKARKKKRFYLFAISFDHSEFSTLLHLDLRDSICEFGIFLVQSTLILKNLIKKYTLEVAVFQFYYRKILFIIRDLRGSLTAYETAVNVKLQYGDTHSYISTSSH